MLKSPNLQRTPLNTLIVAAHATELTPWVNLGRRYFRIRGDTAFLSAGIGPVAAAFGLTHFLKDFRPARIIGVGTAGVINVERFAIGDIVIARSVATNSRLIDLYTPKSQPARITLPRAVTLRTRSAEIPLKTTRGTLRVAHVFSPQEVSRTDARRRLLRRGGFDVEQLESFALAFVAEKFRCPITIVLGLTNVVGPKAHAGWRVNSERVMKRVAKAVAP